MNLAALFKISHGLYIVGASESNNRLVGSCIDAVMVIETNPAQIMVSFGHTSYTAEQILKTKRFTLSVLGKNNPYDIIKRFGFNSSKTMDKWRETPHKMIEGLPILTDSVAVMTVQVVDVKQTATHFVCLCDVIQTIEGTMSEPITYHEYQNHIKNQQVKKENKNMKKYICTVCGYIYDESVEGVAFADLPDDYVCPVCGEPKSAFTEMTD